MRRIAGSLMLVLALLLACRLGDAVAPAVEDTPTPRPRPTSAPTAPPVAVAVPTIPPVVPTAEPVPVSGKATENLRVRSSPSTNGAIVDRLNKGESAQIVGRTAASDWLQIALPSKPTQTGWVSAPFITVAGSMDSIPVVQPGAPGRPPPVKSYP